jgi:uncharacterized OB-fold protein
MSKSPHRPLPSDANRFFWTSGADQQLRMLRCEQCQYWVHPPSPVCPECLSQSLQPSALSGKASILSYTVNHQTWMPGLEEPYVIAIVALDEQEGLRLTTNIIGSQPEDVRIGDRLTVCFEQCDDVWLPLFTRDVDQDITTKGESL